LNFHQRIHSQTFSMSEEFVKTPERREMKPDRRPGPTGFHALEKITPELVGIAIRPGLEVRR
jgi:hypothetical protein